MENHLIDGFLGRSFFLFGLVLYYSPLAWRWYGQNFSLGHGDRAASLWGIGFLFAGAAISLSTVVLSASMPADQTKEIWLPDLELFLAGVGPVLKQTLFGRTWIVALLTIFGFFSVRIIELRRQLFLPAAWQVLSGLWAALVYARLGHGGSFAYSNILFWAQSVHGAAVIVWLVSLGSFAIRVFSEQPQSVSFQLPRFTQTMKFTMPLLLLSGLVRSTELWPSCCSFWTEPYLVLFIVKLAITLLVLCLAFYLRQRIQEQTKSSTAVFRQIFSLEISAAALLVLLSNLLSQLPPP